MKNIREFNSEKEFIDFIDKNTISEIGMGSEGTTYLNHSGELIKNMLDAYEVKKYENYPNIIMEDDIKLESFIFPNELYLLDGIIVGYKEKYFSGNIFNDWLLLKDINFENLIKAREKFIEDAKVLSENGYYLYELPGNLLFDNNRLVAIDTLDYEKRDKVKIEENISSIDYAILYELNNLYCGIHIDGNFEKEISRVYKK